MLPGFPCLHDVDVNVNLISNLTRPTLEMQRDATRQSEHLGLPWKSALLQLGVPFNFSRGMSCGITGSLQQERGSGVGDSSDNGTFSAAPAQPTQPIRHE